MEKEKVFETILARRSIRGFLEKKVEYEKIVVLLQAAMAAPSACNLQPWSFIVVDDQEVLSQVKKNAKQGNYNAPLVIVVCGESNHIPWDGDGWKFDCGAAAQNIMLEVVELGLASVCIGGFDEDALKLALDIPKNVIPVCILEIGYPSYERAPLTWYDEKAVHWQKYNKDNDRVMRTMDMLQKDIESGLI